MLELDFAFFNMMSYNRQGLASQKIFLDRLAPLLFNPRVERLINISDLGWKGCNIFLPLGQGNWRSLQPEQRSRMLEKSVRLLSEYAVTEMAVDRRLRALLPRPAAVRFRFGDEFILALLIKLVDAAVNEQEIKKLVLVGDIPCMVPLIENLACHHLPISIQNEYPGRYEIMAHRLLYEKGLAVSHSLVNPHNWRQGDLIVYFQAAYHRLAVGSPRAFYISMEDERQGLAPELENELEKSGINGNLYALAPILETCLLTKAGIGSPDREEDTDNYGKGAEAVKDSYRTILEAGEDMDLWSFFTPYRSQCNANPGSVSAHR